MRRNLEMDALRGLAAIVIVLAHVGLFEKTAWVESAVDMFFVISGYFITASIFRSLDAPRFYRTFYVRRALRIWPIYYLAFAACLLINRYLPWDHPPDGWPYYFLFLQNIPAYWGGFVPLFSGLFLHTWTLAIEEQYYIVWPAFSRNVGRKGVLVLALMLLVVPFALRARGFIPFLLLTRCDGLALGSILALCLSEGSLFDRRRGHLRVLLAAVGLLALAAPTGLGFARDVLGLDALDAGVSPLFASALYLRGSLVHFALVGLVLSFEGHPWIAFLRDRRLCYVGQISYGLYLYHPFVFATVPSPYRRYIVRKLGVSSHFLMDVAMIGLCFMLAALSRKYVEEPILAWKKRFAYGSENVRGSSGSGTAGWRTDGAHTPIGSRGRGHARNAPK